MWEYDVLKSIKEAKGKDKLDILKEHPNLKPLLKYAYDPFLKYHMKAQGYVGAGKTDDLSDGFDLLDNIVAKEIIGKEAKQCIEGYITTLSWEAAEVFQRVLDKDLRIGISAKSITKVWPDLLQKTEDDIGRISIMLCKTFDIEANNKFPLLAAPKKDGVRARFVKGNLYTRRGKLIKGMSHITDFLNGYPLKGYSWSMKDIELDGELIVRGKAFDEVSGLIRNGEEVTEAIYCIFDCPSYPGNKLGRMAWLKTFDFNCGFIQLLDHKRFEDKESLYTYYADTLSKGDEGLVIYTIDHRYVDGRTGDWKRMVPIKTSDCPCVGFYEGKGRLENNLGGIIVGRKGVKIRVGTGFLDNVGDNLVEKRRAFIWTNQSDFLGRTAEIAYKELTAKGSFRQPRFIGWRDDK